MKFIRRNKEKYIRKTTLAQRYSTVSLLINYCYFPPLIFILNNGFFFFFFFFFFLIIKKKKKLYNIFYLFFFFIYLFFFSYLTSCIFLSFILLFSPLS